MRKTQHPSYEKAIFKENQQALKKKKDNNSPKPSLKQSERKEMEKIGFHFLFELRSCLSRTNC